MATFLEFIGSLQGKNGDVFLDDHNTTWELRADNTGVQLSAKYDGGKKLIFTDTHLNYCRAPEGFRKKPTKNEKIGEIVERMAGLTKELENIRELGDV